MDCLTPRELDVLALIASGFSNAGIERELVLSAKTVESHVRNIYSKLGLGNGGGVHRRVQAALLYLSGSAGASPR
jgi:DNA-binding NarL/FixJ family response regulator